jgi:hypothetical protein
MARMGVVAILLASLLSPVHAATVTATFDRLFIELGETVEFTILVDDASNMQPPNLSSLQNIAGGRDLGPSQMTQIINGARSSQISHRYLLQPAAVGDFNIPSLNIVADGKSLTTQPLRCKVLPAEVHATNMWMKIVTERDAYSLGEVIPFEVQIYAANDVTIRGGAPPNINLDGFVSGHEEKPATSKTYRGGQPYSVFTYRMSATPTRGGDLTLGPATMELTIGVQTRRRGGGFFDDFFAMEEQHKVTLEAEGRKLHVLQPPLEGRPLDYAGAVGRFAATATASRTNLTAGDPITLKIVVTGQGAFETLPTPKLLDQQGLKIYTGTNSFQSGDTLGLIGTKTFEQVVIVESPEIKSLRFEPFSFFDPQSRRYETVSLAPIPIHVVAPVSSNAPAIASSPPSSFEDRLAAQAANQLSKDGLRPLKVDIGRPITPLGVVARSPWFIAIAAGPLLLFGGWRQGIRLAAKRAAAKKPPKAAIQIETLRQQMTNAAKAGNAPHFYSALNHLLQAEIAPLVGVQPATVAGDIIEPQLVPMGLPADEGARLRKLFEKIEAARFGGAAAPGALLSTMQEAESSITALRQLHWRN